MQGAREIDQSFASLRIGAPVHLNLALFPLFDDSEKSSEYLLLDDALDRKLAHVTEVSADGRVQELAFENDSSEKILRVGHRQCVGVGLAERHLARCAATRWMQSRRKPARRCPPPRSTCVGSSTPFPALPPRVFRRWARARTFA